MSLEKRPDEPSLTIEELLAESEKYATWAMNNYGKPNGGNERSLAASSIAQALGVLAIAHLLNEQRGGSLQVETLTQVLNADSMLKPEGE